ncbi:hypothetical protein LR002_00480 [Candidatus Gracilibacteria bacterium]|nr:hypothetical protein [Candidatus Gracilibacteria bacterium]
MIEIFNIKKLKKMYFDFFIKKYGLDGEKVNFGTKDILRRIRMVEFFDYITKEFDLKKIGKGRFLIEIKFFRMVVIETKKQKLELLSFYNFK